MKMNGLILVAFWSWAIINGLAGIWEIYAFYNRDKLILEKQTIWEKIAKGITTFKTFFIDGWSEYAKVDSRYITTTNNGKSQYVWGFELLNAFLSIVFIICLLMKNVSNMYFIKIILYIMVANTIVYFSTLYIETLMANMANNMVLPNMEKYAARWMFPVYYLISSIWIIVPSLLLYLL